MGDRQADAYADETQFDRRPCLCLSLCGSRFRQNLSGEQFWHKSKVNVRALRYDFFRLRLVNLSARAELPRYASEIAVGYR